jgi:tetratricopeptide (TPR) repeat protein
MNYAERFEPSEALAFNYAHHAMVVSGLLGWESRGAKYFKRSIDLRQEMNDVWGLGHSYAYEGGGLYCLCRYDEAIEKLDKAVDSFNQTGDLWELNMATFHRGMCEYLLGNIQVAAADAQSTFADARNMGDTRAMCSSFLWAVATDGRFPFDDVKRSVLPADEDIMSSVNLMKAEGCWHLAHGRTADAVEILEKAWRSAWNHGHVFVHTVATLTILVKARRLHADSLDQADSKRCRAYRKKTLRLANRTAWLSRLFRPERVGALRELALAYVGVRGRTQGSLRKALRIVERSCEEATRVAAKYELAQSRIVRAQLRVELGEANAQQELDEAELVMVGFAQAFEKAQSNVTTSFDKQPTNKQPTNKQPTNKQPTNEVLA